MELKDLFLSTFRVERRGERMVIRQAPDGNYLARSSTILRKALTTNCKIRRKNNIFVRIGRNWRPMLRGGFRRII